MITEERKGLREAHSEVFRMTWADSHVSEPHKTGFRECKDRVLEILRSALAADRREGEQPAPGLREAAQNLVWGCDFDEAVGSVASEAFKKDCQALRAALTALPSPPRDELYDAVEDVLNSRNVEWDEGNSGGLGWRDAVHRLVTVWNRIRESRAAAPAPVKDAPPDTDQELTSEELARHWPGGTGRRAVKDARPTCEGCEKGWLFDEVVRRDVHRKPTVTGHVPFPCTAPKDAPPDESVKNYLQAGGDIRNLQNEDGTLGTTDVDKRAQELIDLNPGSTLSAAYRAVALEIAAPQDAPTLRELDDALSKLQIAWALLQKRKPKPLYRPGIYSVEIDCEAYEEVYIAVEALAAAIPQRDRDKETK